MASSAAENSAGQSSTFPWTSLIDDDFATRALAEAEEALRVTARIVKSSWAGEAKRLLIRLLPCLPVAPSMSRGLVEAMMAE